MADMKKVYDDLIIINLYRKMAKRRAFAGSVVINNNQTIWIMGG